VRSPHLGGTLGDYTLDLPGGQYDSYTRKLSGVQGVAEWPGISFTAAGAVSDGEFHTNNFMAQENVQGPYSLVGKNGEVGIKVLAGTEKVWLDGEEMKRGEGNDYVIDYSDGQITFTSKRIMTSDRRIVVDFEYAPEQFQKLYGAARTEGELFEGKLGGTLTWIDEADDRTRPLATTFTEQDKAALSAAGDDPLRAVVSSADSLGPKQGDYTRRDTVWNDSTYSIFVIVPRDSTGSPQGEWRVTFDDFGEGNGDYELVVDPLGQIFYQWVGPGMGRYRPERKLPLPQDHQLADLSLRPVIMTRTLFRIKTTAMTTEPRMRRPWTLNLKIFISVLISLTGCICMAHFASVTLVFLSFRAWMPSNSSASGTRSACRESKRPFAKSAASCNRFMLWLFRAAMGNSRVGVRFTPRGEPDKCKFDPSESGRQAITFFI
jgi:hypothetical protein